MITGKKPTALFEITAGKLRLKEPLLVIALFLYAAIVVFSTYHHEPWRDEAQVWLLARDHGLLFMLDTISYDGHPLLWPLLLHPFAALGFPYATMFVLHILIAIASAFIFVRYSPFSKITKICFIFSYFMFYEYAVIARNYSITILLLFVIAVFYPHRFKKPLAYALLIVLLINTNVHSLLIGCSLIGAYLLESITEKKFTRRIGVSLSVMSVSVLSLVLLFLDEPEETYWGTFYFHPFNPVIALNKMLLPFQGFEREAQVFFALAIVSLIILSLIKKPYVLFSFIISGSGLSYIFIFKKCDLRHQGLVLILLLFLLWIGTYYKEKDFHLLKRIRSTDISKALGIIITFCLFITVSTGLRNHYLEYKFAFSGSKEAAEFIRGRDFSSYTITTYPSAKASSLLPFLPGQSFWYIERKELGTYVIVKISEFTRGLNTEQILDILEAEFPGNDKLLFLTTRPVNNNKEHFRLVYSTKSKIFYHRDEKFYLYRVVL